MTFLRRLGSGERVFCLRVDAPTHTVSAIEVKGATSIEGWTAALDALQRRHPLLSASIQMGDDGAPAFQRSSAAIPLRVIAGTIPDDWEREMGNELTKRFDISQGPLIRVVLFHEPNRVVAILSILHSVNDGMSSMFLIRDLLTSLSGGRLDPLPLLPAMEDLLRKLPSGPASSRHLPTVMDGRTPVVAPEGGTPCVTRLRLDKTLTSALRERARQEGTSVNGILCAAAVLARQFEAGEAMPVVLSYPIDIRTMLGVGEDNLYLLSGGMMRFPPSAPLSLDDIWALARSAREQVKSAITPGSIQASIAWLEQQLEGSDPLAAIGRFAALFASDIHLTNLGQIMIPITFGQLKLEAGWGAALTRWDGSVMLAAHTVNDRMCLTLTSHHARPRLLSGVEHVLRDACIR